MPKKVYHSIKQVPEEPEIYPVEYIQTGSINIVSDSDNLPGDVIDTNLKEISIKESTSLDGKTVEPQITYAITKAFYKKDKFTII